MRKGGFSGNPQAAVVSDLLESFSCRMMAWCLHRQQYAWNIPSRIKQAALILRCRSHDPARGPVGNGLFVNQNGFEGDPRPGAK
jgi:hypothetical protein